MNKIYTLILGTALCFIVGCSTVKSSGEAVGSVGEGVGDAAVGVSEAVGDAGVAVGNGAKEVVKGTGRAIGRAADRTERKGY